MISIGENYLREHQSRLFEHHILPSLKYLYGDLFLMKHSTLKKNLCNSKKVSTFAPDFVTRGMS